jgi:hypothetical protein
METCLIPSFQLPASAPASVHHPHPCTASHPRVCRFNRGLLTAGIWAAAVASRAGRPNADQAGPYYIYRRVNWPPSGAIYYSAYYASTGTM